MFPLFLHSDVEELVKLAILLFENQQLFQLAENRGVIAPLEFPQTIEQVIINEGIKGRQFVGSIQFALV